MIETLRNIQIFCQLNDNTLETLADNIAIKDYRADETIYIESEPSQYVYIVLSGRVKITKVSNNGREKILHIVCENEMFGEQAIFEDGLNPASAKTLEKAVILQIRLSALKQLAMEDQQCAAMLFDVMNLKLRQAYRQIINLSFKDANSRLASRLFKLARDHGVELDKGLLIGVHLTQQELADYVGTSRETISRILSDLNQRQVLHIERQNIYIKDYQELKQIAMGGS